MVTVMNVVTQIFVGLWVLSTALLYLFCDFNTYSGSGAGVWVYVIDKPGPIERLFYSAGLGLPCGAVVGIGVLAVWRLWLQLAVLIIIYTAIFYHVADLNIYLTDFGPEGQDVVKISSDPGMGRLLQCGLIGIWGAAICCVVLLIATWIKAARSARNSLQR